MLLQPDCIVCTYKASLAAIREVIADEQTIKGLMSEILQIPALREPDWTMTSPELLEIVLSNITASLGNADPFQSIKERQDRKGRNFTLG